LPSVDDDILGALHGSATGHIKDVRPLTPTPGLASCVVISTKTSLLSYEGRGREQVSVSPYSSPSRTLADFNRVYECKLREWLTKGFRDILTWLFMPLVVTVGYAATLNIGLCLESFGRGLAGFEHTLRGRWFDKTLEGELASLRREGTSAERGVTRRE
jgi:hypothetical protein